jgi:hypothetical protein
VLEGGGSVNILNYPSLVLVFTFILLWIAAWVGSWVSHRQTRLSEDLRPDFGTILAASLTMLGLVIGFSFSMATGRYDLRKTYEEAEANAIGTEYVRADLLAPAQASQVRGLLKQYTDLRIEWYRARPWNDVTQLNQQISQVQNQLWTGTSQSALAQPTPVQALAVAGMNDVLNSQGYTQAAWWNRIPVEAWYLLFVIALFCNALLGFGAHEMAPRLFMVLPLLVAIAFFLIADIDSPRGGIIRVRPQNLLSLRSGLGG